MVAKLEIPVVVDISEIESLIDEIKHLQTYRLSYGAEQILVDRDDVIKIFAAHVRANIKQERKAGKTLAEEVERIKREITDIFAEQMPVQPFAQAERMKGRWVKDEEASSQHSESIYVCSACNNMEAWGEVEKNTFKFCPNCGADMRGKDDE